MNREFSPRNTMFVFDIHGVLCKAQPSKIFALLWQSPYKYTILRSMFYPPLWLDAFRLWREDAVAGTYLAKIKTRYPKLIPCIPLFIHMANSQKPNEPVLEIIKTLKEQGYALHILSNIDDEILRDLRTTPCGRVLTYFDEVVGTEAHSYGKPSLDIYKDFIEQHNPERKTMIFIDNKRRNVRGARQAGMVGILFKNGKQLRKVLNTMSVLQ